MEVYGAERAREQFTQAGVQVLGLWDSQLYGHFQRPELEKAYITKYRRSCTQQMSSFEETAFELSSGGKEVDSLGAWCQVIADLRGKPF